jgi:hypothetical protein
MCGGETPNKGDDMKSTPLLTTCMLLRRLTAKKFGKLLLIFCSVGSLAAAAFAQQVTTEMIGPLSGNLTITLPNNPCFGQQDTITLVPH